MHNVVKWPNILQKSCGVNTARFLKYVWSFYNIMHERVKGLLRKELVFADCYTYLILGITESMVVSMVILRNSRPEVF